MRLTGVEMKEHVGRGEEEGEGAKRGSDIIILL